MHGRRGALRQVILDRGGSLSHPHGVGKVRQRFLPQVHPEAGLELARAVKRAVDPGNAFGIGKGRLRSWTEPLGPGARRHRLRTASPRDVAGVAHSLPSAVGQFRITVSGGRDG